MPRYDPATDLIIEELEMSDHQFKLYSEVRSIERKEKRKLQNGARREPKMMNYLLHTESSRYFALLFSRWY